MKIGPKEIILFFFFAFFLSDLRGEIYYPWKDVYIGSLDPKSWAALCFIPDKDCGFAFRIRAKRANETVDSADIFFLVSEVGPHSPDGQYAKLKMDLSLPFGREEETPTLIKPPRKSDTLTLEWSRQDEKTVIGKIEAPSYIELQIIHYFPWDFKGKFILLSDGQVKGENLAQKKYHYLFWKNREAVFVRDDPEELSLSFNMDDERKVYFVAGVGEDARILRNHIYRYKNEKTIESILRDEEKRYIKKRVRVDGFCKGVAESVSNNIFWATLYQRGHHRFYSPPGRREVSSASGRPDNHWMISGWGAFLAALEASLESTRHAEEFIFSILETQYPNGNIPGWRSNSGGTPDHSQPPLGSFVILKIFEKSGNLEFLRRAYPFLKKWHGFWKAEKTNGQRRRDGNGDGLLEWGSDVEFLISDVLAGRTKLEGKLRAQKESGQFNLPNWDEAYFDEKTGTLTMNCIDLNSLYALDAWCLAQISNLLNEKEDYANYMAEYRIMKDLINRNLWDDREGFYFDRHWDGRFSRKKAASNFYPLLAQIPDEKRALQMIKHLLNEKEFWGEYVIPTVSRDDPAFRDQLSSRGGISPPVNYLVYQGLRACKFDSLATEFARKSAELFLRSWVNFQLCPEYFDSRTGEPRGGRHQSFGPLLALIAVEEYLDFNPWEGLRFGMIKAEKKGKLSRLSIQGRHYDLEISSGEMKLKEESREIMNAEGSIIIRHFLYSENEISFETKSLGPREIEIKLLSKGKYELRIDDKEKRVFKGKSVKFTIPEGEHTVLILLLERQE